MNTVTCADPTNSDFIYLCDWVAVTFRGYNEEDHECASLSALLEYIQNDDENWDYQPRLRIRRMPAFYDGNIRIARDDNNLEEVYWTPGTPSEFQSSHCMPRSFIVPERFVREAAETPDASAECLCDLLREVLDVFGAEPRHQSMAAVALKERVKAVVEALDESRTPSSPRVAATALRRFGEGY